MGIVASTSIFTFIKVSPILCASSEKNIKNRFFDMAFGIKKTVALGISTLSKYYTSIIMQANLSAAK
ncbi:hypothetical protein HUJ04_009277 [Dendroctonus ponderosae]|nr:hypothetical protein HUJ04_009277 [Dendroctonus ponderosae]